MYPIQDIFVYNIESEVMACIQCQYTLSSHALGLNAALAIDSILQTCMQDTFARARTRSSARDNRVSCIQLADKILVRRSHKAVPEEQL